MTVEKKRKITNFDEKKSVETDEQYFYHNYYLDKDTNRRALSLMKVSVGDYCRVLLSYDEPMFGGVETDGE